MSWRFNETTQSWEPSYSFTHELTKEAREASQKYWAKGGAADIKYPIHKNIYRWWRIRGENREEVLAAALKRHRGGRPK